MRKMKKGGESLEGERIEEEGGGGGGGGGEGEGGGYDEKKKLRGKGERKEGDIRRGG